jgi:hypothetical protein
MNCNGGTSPNHQPNKGNKQTASVVYDIMIKTLILLPAMSLLFTPFAGGQEADAAPQAIPISTQTLLSGVKSPESKGVIKSVLMIQCPKDNAKGTGFVILGGKIITTNSHVVGSCGFGDLIGKSSVSNEPVKFSAMVRDTVRDLALLCATKPLPFVLKLSGGEKPQVETEVETWGYPLRYQSPAPILSRGYVAGYWTEVRPQTNGGAGTPVEHLIVNGADGRRSLAWASSLTVTVVSSRTI